MGILGLSKLIADIAPSAIKENEMKNFFGKCNTINPLQRFTNNNMKSNKNNIG